MKNKTQSKTKGKSDPKKLTQTSKIDQTNISYYFIVTIIAIILLFIESIYILLSGIKKGFLKKEVLTKKSNLGFDIIIKS
tara:strand:+ start:1036 stop:1275 length:240 start_codon:yes stop_codon:yes gene_type:complete